MNEQSANAKIAPTPTEAEAEQRARLSALHAAMQINNGRGDYQEVIRAARDILAFLKEG